MSRGLLDGGWTVRAIYGARLTTHLPVELRIAGGGLGATNMVVRRPRPLPIDRPVGPQLPGIKIEWDSWAPHAAANGGFDEDRFAHMVELWYAGAECELNTACGRAAVNDEASSLGLGRAATTYRAPVRGKFRDVADELGVLGHRLAWAAKWLRTVQAYGVSAGTHGLAPQQVLTLLGASAKAAGFAAEKWHNIDDDSTVRSLRNGMRWLAALGRPCKDRRPLIVRLEVGSAHAEIEQACKLASCVEAELFALANRRRKQAVRETTEWASAATKGIGHRVTKPIEPVRAATASATKGHLGETTPQKAADCGIAEWSGPWQAHEDDGSSEILAAIEAMDCTWQREPEITLPLFTESRIRDGAKRFRGNTGVGRDWLRPRHVVMLSSGAVKALANIFDVIEAARRWPMLLREVVAVALGKATGGCRLIGLATAPYRIWARVRYLDCKCIWESRLQRPFFAAAPGVGAAAAVFDAAFDCEAAVAGGDEVACTLVDLKQFYEHVEIAEFAKGGRLLGVPWCIISLTAHMYLGPRCIRVGSAYSKRVFPRRSLLPGCT